MKIRFYVLAVQGGRTVRKSFNTKEEAIAFAYTKRAAWIWKNVDTPLFSKRGFVGDYSTGPRS